MSDPFEPFLRAIRPPLYVDGNSLGPISSEAEEAVRRALATWSNARIGGWNADWIELPRRVGRQLAVLIGAPADGVVVADTTSLNLYKLAYAVMRDAPKERRRIVTDDLNFPSDLYILRAVAEQTDGEFVVVPSRNGIEPDEAALRNALPTATLLVLSLVTYQSGFRYDGAAWTHEAHANGAHVLWDLSHAAGAIRVELEAWQSDFAVGCTYKYANGGPGAPGYLYVRPDLADDLASPLPGWFGHTNPFAMATAYTPAPGAARFACSTPPVLSLAAVEGALAPLVDALEQVGLPALDHKAAAITERLIGTAENRLTDLGFRLASPREAVRRGAHVALAHPEARAIVQCLVETFRAVPDFRPPNLVRIGFSPLFNRFEDADAIADHLVEVVATHAYEAFRDAGGVVP